MVGGNGGPPLRLPEIPLGKYNGDPRLWLPWWQRFYTTIHLLTYLFPVQKLNYLMAMLEGPALEAVEGYTPIDDNYPIVLRVLYERFGNPKVIGDALQNELANLPRAADSPPSLWKTTETIARITQQIRQMGLDENHPFIVSTAKSKIPRRVLAGLVEKERSGRQPAQGKNGGWQSCWRR